MTKRSRTSRGIAMILVIMSLLSILTLTTVAATVTETITVPVGQTSFSIPIRVNEPTPHAGIEFGLTISPASAASFLSLTNIPSGAAPSPIKESGGLLYFGFLTSTGSNMFPAGDNLAGTMNFTGYTGNQVLTITVVEMNVTRLDDNKQAVTTKYDTPFVFTVQRPDAQPIFYTVTFDPAGGIRTGGGALSQTVAENGSAIEPVVTRSGYTFNGWDKTFTNVTADMTVTAQWTPIPVYPITWHTDGGSPAPTQTSVSYGGTITQPATMTKPGFTFDGWFANSGLTGTAVVFPVTGVMSAREYWAKWTPGGDGGDPGDPGDPGDDPYPITITMTLPAGVTMFGIPIRVYESTPYAGIEFGLDISPASAVSFLSLTNIPNGTSPSPIKEADGLLYIGFFTTSNVLPVGDTLAGTMNFTGYTGNEVVTITVVKMNVTRLDADNKAVTTTYDSPYVITVQREEIQPKYFTVTFDPTGGEHVGGGELVQLVPEGGSATAPILIRSGYNFNDWDKPIDNVTADMTVTALWTPIPVYTITWNADGGSPAPIQMSVSHGGAITQPAAMTKSGYTFDGWFTNAELTGAAVAFPVSNVTSAKEYWAKWTPIPVYPITWHTDGGSPAPAQTSVSHGGAITQPSAMTKSGYTFDGWFANAELTGAAVAFPVSNVTSAREYWAKWTLTTTGGGTVPGPGPVTYTVTFDPDGGIRTGGGQLTQTVNSGAAATAPILTREGYTFEDWDRVFTNVTANMTVKALWLEDAEIIDDGPPLGEPHVHYFDDVTYTLYGWAEPAVCALAEAGVVKGTANRIYSPRSNIKRGDFILMLARAYGFDEPFTENFPDVPVGSYYYDAIGSAKALGVAEGYGDGTFRPEAPISRQEMMSFIDRTMDTIGKPLPRGSEEDLLAFSDEDLVADYAREHVAALINSGIIIGSNNNRINPRGNTTRAEMAVALHRLMILTGHLTVEDAPTGETTEETPTEETPTEETPTEETPTEETPDE